MTPQEWKERFANRLLRISQIAAEDAETVACLVLKRPKASEENPERAAEKEKACWYD
jgi:hypothetical protein